MTLNHFITTARSQLRNFTMCWDFGPGLQTGLSLTLKKFSRFLKGSLFRKYKKKALLIGINGNGGSEDLLALEGPHRDVRALEELIISKRYQPFRQLYWPDCLDLLRSIRIQERGCRSHA
jgi:hypothetical protein